MDGDPRGRLVTLHRNVPDGTADLESVVSAGRRRKRWRALVGAGTAAAMITAGVMGVQALTDRSGSADDTRPRHHGDGVFVPAREGQRTYELYDFEILYPWAPVDRLDIPAEHRDRYCSIRDEWECGHRREQAGFSYEWRWATKRYPGSVQCRVTLLSRDGSVVGRAEWGLSGLETTSRKPHVMPVRVSGRPERAQARCEAGEYAPGRGVDVEFVRSEPYTPSYPSGMSPPPERIRLIFEAEALADDHIDSRMCFMTLWFESGRRVGSDFTTNRGEGTWEFETGYPASDPVEDARMRCRAIRGSDS